jgi:hypothetical protein
LRADKSSSFHCLKSSSDLARRVQLPTRLGSFQIQLATLMNVLVLDENGTIMITLNRDDRRFDERFIFRLHGSDAIAALSMQLCSR